MRVAWTLIILITLFDCAMILQHPEWEGNPVQCWIINHCDVRAAVLLRMSTVVFCACLMPFAGRLRWPATAIVLAASLLILSAYARILC